MGNISIALEAKLSLNRLKITYVTVTDILYLHTCVESVVLPFRKLWLSNHTNFDILLVLPV